MVLRMISPPVRLRDRFHVLLFFILIFKVVWHTFHRFLGMCLAAWRPNHPAVAQSPAILRPLTDNTSTCYFVHDVLITSQNYGHPFVVGGDVHTQWLVPGPLFVHSLKMQFPSDRVMCRTRAFSSTTPWFVAVVADGIFGLTSLGPAWCVRVGWKWWFFVP